MKAKKCKTLIYAVLLTFVAFGAAFAQTEISVNEKKITADLEKQKIFEQSNQKKSSIKINVASEFDSVLRIPSLERKTIRLEITVEQPRNDIEGFRVFLDKSNADAATPTDIPEYIGTVSFYAGNPGENTTFLFDLEKFKSPFSPKETSCEDEQKLILSIIPIKNDRNKTSASNLLVKEVSFVVTPEN